MDNIKKEINLFRKDFNINVAKLKKSFRDEETTLKDLYNYTNDCIENLSTFKSIIVEFSKCSIDESNTIEE